MENLSQKSILIAAFLATGFASAYAEDVTAVLTPVADTWVLSTSESTNAGSKTTLEVYDDETNSKKMYSLMSFDLSIPAGKKVKSASLRLVTERRKGASTMSIYAYGNDFNESTATWTTEESYVTTALASSELTSFTIKALSGKSLQSDDVSASPLISDWTNTIDLTTYAKSLQTDMLNILLSQTGSNQDCFFSKEAVSFDNTKIEGTTYSYATADIIPQLTVTYEDDLNSISSSTGSIVDTYLRAGNTSNHGNETTFEICSYTDDADATKNKDFIGVMSFNFPAEAISPNYTIKSATLRLVTERIKGNNSMNLYAYHASFTGNDTYAAQESNISAAKANDPVATFNAKGEWNKAVTSDAVSDTYKTVDAWTNEIDLTNYAKSLTTNSISLMLTAAENNKNSEKFFTSEATDFTNTKDATLSFAAADIIPQLTIVYEKNTYDLTVTSAKASTLVLPYNATIPTGVKAYTLTYTSGEKATATEVTNVLPANTPVLVNAEAGDYTFTATANTTVGNTTPLFGALIGVYETTIVPTNAYVLQNHSGSVMFYIVNSNDLSIEPNHAYLQASASQASSIELNFPVITGINQTTTATEMPTAIYNLMGVKIQSDRLTKGMYIKNGKKFIIK